MLQRKRRRLQEYWGTLPEAMQEAAAKDGTICEAFADVGLDMPGAEKQLENLVAVLEAAGYGREDARRALQATEGNLQEAHNFLLAEKNLH